MKTKWIIFCFIVLLSLLSCTQGIFEDASTTVPEEQVFTDPPESPGPSEEQISTGNLTIKVPMISSYLAEAMGISYTDPVPESRAILIVSKVDFDLYDSGDTLVDSWEYISPAGEEGPGGGSEEPLTTKLVPAAGGYTLKADIYNAAVSTETPILSGMSDPFDVASGVTTDVTIAPTPVSPTLVASADTPVAIPDASFTSTYWDGVTLSDPDGVPDSGDEMPAYTWGKEHWFEINNSGALDAMRITATPDALSAAVLMITGPDGHVMTMALSGNSNPEGGAWIVNTDATLAILSPASTYYAGLITVNDGTSSVNSTVDISFTAFADDANEENDTTLTATPIAKGTIESGIDLDPRAWDMSSDWPNTGGDLFQFTLTAEEDPTNVDMALVFDHDQGDLILALYDDTGFEIAWADASTSEIGQETIADPTGLTVGSTYYILVASNNWPVGNTYQLQWVSGEGTISIGIE